MRPYAPYKSDEERVFLPEVGYVLVNKVKQYIWIKFWIRRGIQEGTKIYLSEQGILWTQVVPKGGPVRQASLEEERLFHKLLSGPA